MQRFLKKTWRNLSIWLGRLLWNFISAFLETDHLPMWLTFVPLCTTPCLDFHGHRWCGVSRGKRGMILRFCLSFRSMVQSWPARERWWYDTPFRVHPWYIKGTGETPIHHFPVDSTYSERMVDKETCSRHLDGGVWSTCIDRCTIQKRQDEEEIRVCLQRLSAKKTSDPAVQHTCHL